MTTQADSWTIGVEEEYQLIDPATRELQGRAERTLEQAQATLGDAVQPELQHSQIETATPVCQTLTDVRDALVRLRRELITAATRNGSRLAAAGTHPFSRWDTQQITPKARYQEIARRYGQLARELVICGCHVHVGLSDREVAIGVLNRVRVWLTPLLALAANSPFWLGEDTGYASYRTELWARWPMAGPPHCFASRDEYETLVRALVATGSIADATNIYWDVRLPERFPTVEFRVTDVCLTIDEAVMVAGLVRALAQTCYEQALRDAPFATVRPELLRMAHWRAARYGLEGELIDVQATQAVPAQQLVEQLLIFVQDALEANGDWDEIAMLVRETLDRGNGAMRQRAVFERAGRMEDVVDFIVAETAKGTALG
jgi:glutamate---cysteine ligase / carboxylate-amine ligase